MNYDPTRTALQSRSATHHLDVRVPLAGEAPLPPAALLLAVLEDRGVPDDGDGVAVVAERERLLADDVLSVVVRDGKHDGHGLVRHAVVQKRVVVQALQVFSLSHETCKEGRKGQILRVILLGRFYDPSTKVDLTIAN